MKKTEVIHLLNNDKELVGIKVITELETFIVPVVDATRSEQKREKARLIIKEQNRVRGSKFFRPTYSAWGYSYNKSMKGVRP